MKGLSGTRVLLLDDEEQEAFPIIRALSKAGIATVYFDGTKEGLPKEKQKLRGVRLAILDIDLGTPGADKSKASTLVQVLGRIIDRDNGPYGVLLWTKHPEDKEQVSEYLFKSDLPNPVFVEMLTKSGYMARPTGGAVTRFRVNKLSKAVSTKLSENSPLECMQVWEGSCFEAATRVINRIGDLSTNVADQLDDWRREWQQEMLKLLFAISHAKAEKHLSAENCIPSMFQALNPLHSDRMDLLVEGSSAPLARYAVQIMSAKGGSAIERKAKVNSMLHLGFDRLGELEPGNLYIFPKRHKPAYMPKLGDVLGEAIMPNAPQEVDIMRSARALALEVTPACDYAQDKMRVARFCAGFVLPSTYEKNRSLKKDARFLKPIGPFDIPSKALPENICTLYFNSRYMISCKPGDLRGRTATARVRHQLLADVQSWLAYQGSRQGIMLLR